MYRNSRIDHFFKKKDIKYYNIDNPDEIFIFIKRKTNNIWIMKNIKTSEVICFPSDYLFKYTGKEEEELPNYEESKREIFIKLPSYEESCKKIL